MRKANAKQPPPPLPLWVKSRKHYGFCCDPFKNEPLSNSRPESDPTLKHAVLDAGSPNLKIKFQEIDRMPPPVKRTRK